MIDRAKVRGEVQDIQSETECALERLGRFIDLALDERDRLAAENARLLEAIGVMATKARGLKLPARRVCAFLSDVAGAEFIDAKIIETVLDRIDTAAREALGTG